MDMMAAERRGITVIFYAVLGSSQWPGGQEEEKKEVYFL